jgi:hypothetical protein
MFWNQLGQSAGDIWQGLASGTKKVSNFIGQNYKPVLKAINTGAKFVEGANKAVQDWGLDLIPGVGVASKYLGKTAKFIDRGSAKLIDKDKDIQRLNREIQKLPDKLKLPSFFKPFMT